MREALGDFASRAQAASGGRAVPADRVHVTLFFLGNVERESIAALEAVAGRLEVPAFEVTLDRVDYWRHNRIVWAGTTATPAPLADLASNLSEALAPLGFTAEDRPYVPHVTLVRNAKRAPKGVVYAPVRWLVRDWVLAESVPVAGRSSYRVISRRQLGV